MAFTINTTGGSKYPVGTVVTAYTTSRPEAMPETGVAPTNYPWLVTTGITGTVDASGNLSIAGLTEATNYVLAAQVGGQWRYENVGRRSLAVSTGGASIVLGTAAARPATPASDFYFATDTNELSIANVGKTAWLGIGQISGALAAGSAGANLIAAANNFGVLGVGGTQSGFKLAANRLLLFGDDLAVTTAGKGLAVKEGANCRQGIATLVGGTVTVANTVVTASSRIFLTNNNPGGTPGFVRVSARVVGTSFTILSSSGTDTSDVAWQICEPSP